MVPAKTDTSKRRAHLDTREVAQWLGYSVRTITLWAEQWRDSGGKEGIPGFKIGRAWRFDTGELQRWLEAPKKKFLTNRNLQTRAANTEVTAHAALTLTGFMALWIRLYMIVKRS